MINWDLWLAGWFFMWIIGIAIGMSLRHIQNKKRAIEKEIINKYCKKKK